MASHPISSHMSNDDQPCEEQMKFPYLLTLDSDMELLKDETLEEMALQEEPKAFPPKTVAAQTLHTIRGTTEITRANPIPNLTIATFATSSSTANTPITVNTGTESSHLTDETLNTLRNQLAEAQKEIADLRHHADKSDIRALEQGLRLVTMENTLRQLMLLCPTLESAVHMVGNSMAQATQHGTPTEEDTEAKATNHKRNWEESPNNNLTQPQAKRAKTVKADVTGPKEEQGYAGNKPYCSLCNCHHVGPCGAPCSQCKSHGHQTKDCRVKTCFKCGSTGHFKIECPQLKIRNNNNRRKKTRGGIIANNASETELDSNKVAGTSRHNNLNLTQYQ